MHRTTTGSSPFVGREREMLLALSEGLAATGDRSSALAWARAAHDLAAAGGRESVSSTVAELAADAAAQVAALGGGVA